MTRGAAILATLLALVIVLASASEIEYSMLSAQKTMTTTTVTSSTTETTTVTATTLSMSGQGAFSPNVVVYLQGISHWETDVSPSIVDSYWYYRGGFEGISPGDSDCLGCVDFPLGTNFTVDATYGVMPTSWYRSGSVNITSVRVDSIALYPKGVFTIVGANVTWPFVVSSNNATTTVALNIMCPGQDYSGVLVIGSNMTALAEYTGSPTNST